MQTLAGIQRQPAQPSRDKALEEVVLLIREVSLSRAVALSAVDALDAFGLCSQQNVAVQNAPG